MLKLKKKIYPGYVLVDMVVTDDSWYVVRNTPRVTGFRGRRYLSGASFYGRDEIAFRTDGRDDRETYD